MRNLLVLSMMICLVATSSYGQSEPNPITTAAPFLMISPDARAGGLADMGVATSTDGNSQHYNPAKYVFMPSEWQISLNYTPWLRNLTNDVSLTSLFVSNRISERSAWGASLKYFSLGSIELTDGSGISLGTENPNEFALDGSYSLRLSDYFSMGVALRYIHSNLAINVDDSEIQTINTFAVDLSGFYQSEEKNYGSFNGIWRAGFNLSNMGPKVQMVVGGQESFIPTNLKLGTGFEFILDRVNTITANVEFNKLLVPTPPIRDQNTGEILKGKDDNVSFAKGMFQSFYDAPDGFSEEIDEVTLGFSGEYMYDKTFAVRAGYFYESPNKGNRQFFTVGAGFKFKSTTLDMSYLINTSDVNNPLESTLRFSLAINLGDTFEYY